MQISNAVAPLGFRRFDSSAESWGTIDQSLIEGARGDLPQFPLHVLSDVWQLWARDAAESAGAPVDYVAQGLFACVSAVTGAGVLVEVTPGWREPLVLWQMLVGAPSSGKSPALAMARRLLDPIQDELRAADEERQREHATKAEQARLLSDKWKGECEAALERGVPPPIRPPEAAFDETFVARQIITTDPTVEALADVISGNPQGVTIWRDELTGWLGNLSRYSGGSDRPHYLEAWAAASVTINRKSRSGPLHLRRFPVSIIGTLQPDRLSEALTGADDGMSARFLFSWPAVPRYHSILHHRSVDHDGAQARLRRIFGVTGTVENPLILPLVPEAMELLDTFLGELHAEAQSQEGLEAGFLGKGRGTVIRLAGILSLLRWSEGDAIAHPPPICLDDVRDAAGLWSDYFRHHAQSAIYRAGRNSQDRNARRVIRWLKSEGCVEVSREDVRRDALAQAVDAAGADLAIGRLVEGNVLRALPSGVGPTGGRPAKRWAVNPSLLGRGSDA
jgi:hypothetical protein